MCDYVFVSCACDWLCDVVWCVVCVMLCLYGLCLFYVCVSCAIYCAMLFGLVCFVLLYSCVRCLTHVFVRFECGLLCDVVWLKFRVLCVCGLGSLMRVRALLVIYCVVLHGVFLLVSFVCACLCVCVLCV